jgi:hypothetical protein
MCICWFVIFSVMFIIYVLLLMLKWSCYSLLCDVITKTAVNTLKIIISLKFDTVQYFNANVSFFYKSLLGVKDKWRRKLIDADVAFSQYKH